MLNKLGCHTDAMAAFNDFGSEITWSVERMVCRKALGEMVDSLRWFYQKPL